MEINQRIFFLLERQGKTAKELGDYIGIKPSSISAWKNENSYPSTKYVIRISEFFDVSIDYLFTGRSSLSNSTFTTDQQELVDTYNQLDRRGQHRVHTVIYEELDRIAGGAAIPAKGNAV